MLIITFAAYFLSSSSSSSQSVLPFTLQMFTPVHNYSTERLKFNQHKNTHNSTNQQTSLSIKIHFSTAITSLCTELWVYFEKPSLHHSTTFHKSLIFDSLHSLRESSFPLSATRRLPNRCVHLIETFVTCSSLLLQLEFNLPTGTATALINA